MDSNDLNLYADAKTDAEKWLRRLWHKLIDNAREWATAALAKTVAGSIAGAGLAILVWPWFVVAFVAASIATLIVYSVYATRRMITQRSQLGWSIVENKRLQQKVLELEDRNDQAVIALIEGRSQMSKVRPMELREAVAYLRSKYTEEKRAEQSPLARVHSPRPATPPNVANVKTRMKVRAAKQEEFETAIQALKGRTPEAIIAAEEAKRGRKQMEADARAADRAAQERVRRSRTASPSSPELMMRVAVTPFGDRSVDRMTPPPTPEQIALGEGRTAPATSATPASSNPEGASRSGPR